jgi:hypothetical protein
MAATVVDTKSADVGAGAPSNSGGKLAAHLEDAGCRGAGCQQQQQQRG